LSEISDKEKCKQKSHSSGNMLFISIGKRDAVSRGNALKLLAVGLLSDLRKNLDLLGVATAQRGGTKGTTDFTNGMKLVSASIIFQPPLLHSGVSVFKNSVTHGLTPGLCLH